MASPDLRTPLSAVVASSSFQSFSPQAPTDLVGEYPDFSQDMAVAVVVAASAAQRRWWSLGAAARSAALMAGSLGLRSRRDEAVAMIVREVGKPVSEAQGEVARAISILEYYAQASFAASGDMFPPSLRGLLYTERRPHGVAVLITPWNFPLAIPL
jgi:acyl-CoA reductase-like NAD-dependent aldehyde dehydrogenase